MAESPTTTIRKLGTILGVWAHPDDEVFSCGGIMAMARANGQRVMCATATKGEAGVQDESRWPASQLADIRTQELKQSYAILGLNEHCWFEYADGTLASVSDEEGTQRVLKCIDACTPDSILTFGPDGMTGHDDHRAVSRWATEAARLRGIAVYHAVMTPDMYTQHLEAHEQFNIFFNTDKPPLVAASDCSLHISLPDDVCTQKCEALRAMESQTANLIEFMGHEKLCAMVDTEAFVRG